MALKSIFDSEIPMIGIDRSTKKSRFFSIADIRNLRSSKEYGAFTPFGGYSSVITVPSLVSILGNYTRITFKVPYETTPLSDQVVGVFADSDNPENVYFDKEYVSGTNSWVNRDWSFLDVFGPYVCDVTSTVSSIIPPASAYNLESNDYYNGWYVFLELSALSNLVVAAQVIDYVASTGQLVLRSNAFTNIVAGTDRFWLSRSIVEGNSGLTGFDVIVGDEIKFSVTPEGLLIYTSSSNPWPEKRNYFISGIDRKYFEQKASFKGIDISLEQFPRPFIGTSTNFSGLISSITPQAGGVYTAFEDGVWQLAVTIEYDGMQESIRSLPLTVSVSGGNKDSFLLNNVRFPFEASYDTGQSKFIKVYDDSWFWGSGTSDISVTHNPFLLLKRATGMNIYLKSPSSESFLLARKIPFNYGDGTAHQHPFEFTYTDGIAKLDTTGEYDEVTSKDYSENNSIPYRDVIRTTYDHLDYIDGAKIASNIQTDQGEYFPGLLMLSRVRPDGIQEKDVFSANRILNLQQKLENKITATYIFGKETTNDSTTRPLVLVFTEKDLYRLYVDVQNVSNWKLSDTLYSDGTKSSKSIISFLGKIFYFGTNKRYLMFDGNESVEIGLGLKGYNKTLISNETDAIGIVYPEYNIIGFIHPSDQIGVFFDLNYIQDQKFSYISYNTPIIVDFSTDTILNVFHAQDGSYLIASDAIFKMNETLTQDSTEITASILLSNFKPSSNYILPNELEIVSKTTNGLSLKLYIDDILKTTYSINGQTIEKSEKHKIDAKLRGQNIKFLIESLSGSSVFNFNDLLIDINSDNL